MNARKQKQLEEQGWAETDVQELFGLTAAEAAYVELMIALSNAVRARRLAMGLTQQRLAELLESSQSRVAKMEAADPSVSLDRLIRAMLAMGATPREVGAVLAADVPAPAVPRPVRARVAPRGRTGRRAAQG
ncbi:MAG TPA: helix-turn-helix domain-containing protein [Longimicrobium sp.]|jgi:predicted XRE-type DNA-binding protein|uniref:helix-turn-helix domain-containing protein n=1 Tax=Longimicrobium sp. TaxID=2029185 RepID=UPI002ED912C0